MLAGAATPVTTDARLIRVGEEGHEVRVTIPPRLIAGREYDLVLEVLDPTRKPVSTATISAQFRDPDGVTRMVAAKRRGKGRYELRRRFALEGHYHFHVMPVPAKRRARVSFALDVEPAAAPARPPAATVAAPREVSSRPVEVRPPAPAFPRLEPRPEPPPPEAVVTPPSPGISPPEPAEPPPAWARPVVEQPEPVAEPVAEEDPYRILEDPARTTPDAGLE